MSRQSIETSSALIGLMRESTWTLRSIASVVILTFGGLVTAPAVAAVKQEVSEIQWHKADATNAAKLYRKMEETHAFLTKLAAHDPKSLDLAASHEQLRALKADLESLDKGAMDEFATNEAHIKAHNLPAVIEQRQQDAVKTYRSRMDTLKAELKAADGAKDVAGFMTHVAAAKAHLDKVQVKPFHKKFDPKNLPFSVAKPTNVKPRLTKQDYKTRPVAPPKRAQVAANGPLTGILTAADVTGALPASPADPSYVAPTDDVQITPAIQAQAKALNNNPVQIYNWVHNNIEYIPTYGSIQGSDMTLQTLKGNDFDQASLLIALLRASNIPSRYVYGTIQVPIAQVENWVGGVTDPNAALNLMSQGGIPVTGLVQGGQIKYAQLEHVWVEAWVNYIPSLAAKPGPGNTWVPMDASYKQYDYTQGMNLQQAVPFDANSVATQAAATGLVDTANSSVSGIDQSFIDQQVHAYQTNLQNYISGVNPNATVGDVVGSKTIHQIVRTQAAASTPFLVNAVGGRYTSIPGNQVWKFAFELDNDVATQVFTYSATTPDVAGKLVALSFVPATEADEALIASYVPTSNADGSSISLAQISATLPSYLINVIPQLTINGQVVAIGSAIALGDSLQSQKGYAVPGQEPVLVQKTLTAGEYHAIGLDLIGSMIDPPILDQTLSNSKAILANNGMAGLASDGLTAALLQSTVYKYFETNNANNFLAAPTAHVSQYRLPSMGEFHISAHANELAGVPVQMVFDGATMDIDFIHDLVDAADNDHGLTVSYEETAGMRASALEHVIPEEYLTNTDNEVHGISAVKAIQLSAAAGYKIYTITASNIATILPEISVDNDVKADITNAVNAGDTVTVPEANITYSGWTGTGYIMVDPLTGSGAYKISGNADGAFVFLALAFLFAIFAILSVATFGVFNLIWPIFAGWMGIMITQFQANDPSVHFDTQIFTGVRLIGMLAMLLFGLGPFGLIAWAIFAATLVGFLISSAYKFGLISYEGKIATDQEMV